MQKTKFLQECRSHAAILRFLFCASGQSFGSKELCNMLFSQHEVFTTLHNYYIVLANVNGHFGLDFDVFSRFRHLGSYFDLKMWLTSEGWSMVSLVCIRESVYICFSTQFLSEGALSGKNMASEPFCTCKMRDWNHVGVSHETCHCSVLRCFDLMKQFSPYVLSNHFERPSEADRK